MLKMTLAILDTTGKFANTSVDTREKAMSRARGYKRIAAKEATQREKDKWLAMAHRSVKSARSANRMLISLKRMEKSCDRHLNLLLDIQSRQ